MKPVKRRELIRKLSTLGYEGPKGKGKHQFMQRGAHKISVPNPHGSMDVKATVVREVVQALGISQEEWENL